MTNDIDWDAADPDMAADPANRPQDSIDVYDKASSPTAEDEFLDNNNLGLGVYDQAEQYQQVESYKMGIFADAAFGRRLEERAIAETKRQLAIDGWHADGAERTNGDAPDSEELMAVIETHRDTETDDDALAQDLRDRLTHDTGIRGWTDLSDAERGEKDRSEWLQRRGEQIWETLSETERGRQVAKVTGYDGTWRPPHWRMIEVRNETSRSLGGRLLDNLFSRVEEVHQSVSERAGDSLLGGER